LAFENLPIGTLNFSETAVGYDPASAAETAADLLWNSS
jgi:hypothetical protein